MEKILKTIDSLKMPSLSGGDTNIPGTISSAVVAASDAVKTNKKERMNHCRTVTDAVCSSNVQNLGEFHQILEKVVEVLFQLCDDSDSEIRLVAIDCLHRIARTLRDSLQPKLHYEIYKEIQRNQSDRSLKTALNLFAFVSPSLRSNKQRAFLSSLVPCFSQISKRTEETLYNNLAQPITQIFQYLGTFAHDSEIKILCKDFIANLRSPSAIIRRNSASILVAFCRFSRNPHETVPRLLTKLIDIIVPNLMEKEVPAIIGVMMCVRQCIPILYQYMKTGKLSDSSPEQELLINSLIQIYEICMLLCNHDDNNVVTTTLECLQEFLTFPPEPVIALITADVGIRNSLDNKKWNTKLLHQEGSQEILVIDPDSENLYETDTDLPKFRSAFPSETSESQEIDAFISAVSSRRNSDALEDINDVYVSEENFHGLDNVNLSEDEMKLSISPDPIVFRSLPDIQIGSLYDESVPLQYCARFLTYNFLLSGHPDVVRSDSEIKISAKVLAENCLTNIIIIYPRIFEMHLAYTLVETDKVDSNQKISDVLLFARHCDPLLRGTTYIMIGNYIKSAIQFNRYHVEKIAIDLIQLTDLLKMGIMDVSNVGVKCAISGITSCLSTLFDTPSSHDFGGSLFMAAASRSTNPYWLVKVDIINMISSISWGERYELVTCHQTAIQLLLKFLTDGDHRVRAASVNAISLFIKSHVSRNPAFFKAVFRKQCLIEECSRFFDRTQIHHKHVCSNSGNPTRNHAVRSVLENFLRNIYERIQEMSEKNSLAGLYNILAKLSEEFPPAYYWYIWRVIPNNGNSCLSLCSVVDFLRVSPWIGDLNIHQSVLTLAINIFCANKFYFFGGKERTSDDNNPFRCLNSEVAQSGILLIRHCLSVIKLYHQVVENSNTSSKKSSLSPVTSPVKKISQKLEPDKASESESEKKRKLTSGSGVPSMNQNHMKLIHHSIGQSWKIYKSSLDANNKFTALLKACLISLKKLFVYIRPDFPGMNSLIDQVLTPMSAVFGFCQIEVIQLTRQMLDCVFSLSNVGISKDNGGPTETECDSCEFDSFFEFVQNYDSILTDTRKVTTVKNLSEKGPLENYIRQFEPVVVKALRTYTTTSDVAVLCEVLRMLTQLIKGHVNYGLIDSNQVFLGYVVKQLGSFTDGNQRKSKDLVQEIFWFLSLLVHENSSKSVMDVSNILSLSNNLLLSSDSGVNEDLGVAALKVLVYDMFIIRTTNSQSNKEKMDNEHSRESVLKMLEKEMMDEDVIPSLWLLLRGRKLSDESKWCNESAKLLHSILPRLQDRSLKINSMHSFYNVITLFLSFHAKSLPLNDRILGFLSDAFEENVPNFNFAVQWCIVVNCYWIMLLRNLQMNSSNVDFDAGLIFRCLKIFMDLAAKFSQVDQEDLILELCGCHFQIVQYLLNLDGMENVREELGAPGNEAKWIDLVSVYAKDDLSKRMWLSDLITVLNIPHPMVWSNLFKNCDFTSTKSLEGFLLLFLHQINQNEISSLEDWVVENYTDQFFLNLNRLEVKQFLDTSNTFRIDKIFDKIDGMLQRNELDTKTTLPLLNYLKCVAERFPCKILLICIRLLKNSPCSAIGFHAGQLCCNILSCISTRKILLSSSQHMSLRSLVSKESIRTRYPRVVSCARFVIKDIERPTKTNENSPDQLIRTWCGEKVNESEGYALVKMLHSMDFHKLTATLSDDTFNLMLLAYCFKDLYMSFRLGSISASDLRDLFSIQKRHELIDKFAFPVAAMEHILDTLDSWEAVTNRFVSASGDEHDPVRSSVSSKIVPVWSALTEMLRLKKATLSCEPSVDKDCCSNFIPTGIFTMSFQVMSLKAKAARFPFSDFKYFLNFAAMALSDEVFLSFFDVRDNFNHIFVCLNELREIVFNLINTLGSNLLISEKGNYEDKDDECYQTLSNVQYLLEFVKSNLKTTIEPDLFLPLHSVISGLGRCELINGWVLISHMSWKPQLLSSSDPFPAIQQIPLEILQNDEDMLLEYISKLSTFGVASKIQFEENWVVFLSVINLYADERFPLQIVATGLRALAMMLRQSVKTSYFLSYKSEEMETASNKIDVVFMNIAPTLSDRMVQPTCYLNAKKVVDNIHNVDVTSCIRFLIDLYSQWLLDPQGKMPLYLLSEVVQSINVISEYFDDSTQFSWMYDTLLEIQKSSDKEDDILWPHLMYGIFHAASKIQLENEAMTYLVQLLETSVNSVTANVANYGLKAALVFLQNQPNCLTIINAIVPYALKCIQLDEMTKDMETHVIHVWSVLLYVWIYGPEEGIVPADFEQDIVRNILTALSPLNKVFVSVRILLLKALQHKVQTSYIKSDKRKTISNAVSGTFRTPNASIFFEALKLYLLLFYNDFADHAHQQSELDPEVLMHMGERSDVLFQLLKSKVKLHNQMVSKCLALLVTDFLPPSEILNRVMAEFLSPTQTTPELLAPVVVQVFEKAKRRVKEAALVREWMLSSIHNFINNMDISRTLWSLTIFFMGVSLNKDVSRFLPFAEIRRKPTQTQQLFLYSFEDFYNTLEKREQENLTKTFSKMGREQSNPYGFVLDFISLLERRNKPLVTDSSNDDG